MGRKKGQLVFEFVIATVLFIGIIIFVLNMLTTNVGIYSVEYGEYAIDSKVVSVSEALLKSSDGVGLGKDWPVLSNAAMLSLMADCTNDYVSVINKLDLIDRPDRPVFETYNVKITIDALGGDSVMDCNIGSQVPVNVTSASIRRFALSEDGEILDINIWIW